MYWPLLILFILGYGYGKPTYGGYPTPTPTPEPEDEVEPVDPPPKFDYNAYTTAYFNKIDEYTHAQNDYKTDTLNVKVNWDLQPAGYQYLKSQYGIYPQVHRPLRPYGEKLSLFTTKNSQKFEIMYVSCTYSEKSNLSLYFC